ncbi:uncharacterized protein M6B38_280565 [Iris pallida]|uniref:Uncharacterized protein n=1 Tax=Iris pallida TaxID=29817 RepID=A0AAX6HZL6_IRIPA|nr:uncharacterized protein M6B38_206375 [Iris pallida]KAJ6846382.1 uncharacterized protein M6B38_280565 [Iris pallida]
MQYYYYLLLLSSFLLFSQSTSQTSAPAGTLERTTKQQVIASIPPGASVSPESFLTSPSGKYAAYFLRTETAPGAGGFGNDFCYIQVQDTSTGEGVWESECTPVSTANSCTLAFSDDGLAIYDGSTPQWDNSAESADNDPLETLELVDEGDMRLRDKIGELAWRASEDPRVNQKCGAPGSPGLAPAMPPFASPIGGANMPFGQQGGPQEGQAVPAEGATGTFGFSNEQPLMDNSPFESGSRRTVEAWLGMGVGLVVTLLGFGIAEFYY